MASVRGSQEGKTKKSKAAAKKTAGVVSADDKPNGGDGDGPIDRLALVRQMIRRCTEEMDKGAASTKSVVAEVIRLLALEKELAEEQEAIREIRVTWVEPTETASSR
jgi:hypothetical protein